MYEQQLKEEKEKDAEVKKRTREDLDNKYRPPRRSRPRSSSCSASPRT